LDEIIGKHFEKGYIIFSFVKELKGKNELLK